jgi:hypothetical protein
LWHAEIFVRHCSLLIVIGGVKKLSKLQTLCESPLAAKINDDIYVLEKQRSAGRTARALLLRIFCQNE